jgi:hypothetical protein
MNPPVYEIEIRGLTEQIMKLRNFDSIAGRHFRSAGETSIKFLERGWKIDAPVDKGRYRSSITGQVKSVVGASVVAIVGTNVRSDRGFPYPAALEESARYHYRRGPRRGQPTMGRVKRLLKQASGTIQKTFDKAVKRIVKDLEI